MWPFRNDGPSFVSGTFRQKPSVNQRIRMLSISHGCSNHSNFEMETECLTKTLSYLNLNISEQKMVETSCKKC